MIRDPLLHFLGIGLLLFALFGAFGRPATDTDRIDISQALVDDLKAQHQTLWGRPPTSDELQGLVDSSIADEIFYREGLAMGLDRNDAVIKRRIRQKYDLITEQEDAVAATDADLQAYLRTHAERFRTPPVIAFTQVMVATEGSPAEVERRLHAIKASLEQGADPTTAGMATLLPTDVPAQAMDLIARDFGEHFAAQLPGLPTGRWQGPLRSAYGLHLVRINQVRPAGDPSLDRVRAEVEREWANDRRQAARARRLEELRQRYDVVIEQ